MVQNSIFKSLTDNLKYRVLLNYIKSQLAIIILLKRKTVARGRGGRGGRRRGEDGEREKTTEKERFLSQAAI